VIRFPRWSAAAAALVAAAFSSTAATARPAFTRTPLEIGAVTPELLDRSLVQRTVSLLTAANLAGAVRVTITWKRGQTALDPNLLADLSYGIDQAQAAGADAYLTIYPDGSSETPVTAADRAAFARFAASLARSLPRVRHVIVGNEPNLNRFWMPQFGPGGTDVAAPAYERLLAQTYDALKAASPGVEVVGGTLAHRGADVPGTGRDTHSPKRFILDLGAAYRASGRRRPIMDAFAYHPYMERSSLPPTFQHLLSTTLTIADYGKLVSLLGRAFDGTGQSGSALPIVYAEFGVESLVPPAEQELYSGTEPSSTHPVPEAVQARYYAQAMQLAACQPTVRTFLVFRLIDSPTLPDWQSGLYYADRATPKSSRDAVAAAAARARTPAPTGCARLLAPRPLVSFFPRGRPTHRFPTVKPILLLCDEDCEYELELYRLRDGTVLADASGDALAGVRVHVAPGRRPLPRGSYGLRIRVRATAYAANAFTAKREFGL
jgi:hypothetical protein